MFWKTTGIIGTLAILATIVMVCLSPRAKGFYPDLFSFGAGTETGTETVDIRESPVHEPGEEFPLPDSAAAPSIRHTPSVHDSVVLQ